LGELRVALTRMAVAPGPPAGEWQPRDDVVYDGEDQTSAAGSDPSASASDTDGNTDGPSLEVTIDLSRPRLGFQDQRRLLDRVGIPDPTNPGGYIPAGEAFGSRAADAEAAIGEIYKRLREAGGTDPAVKPIIRFLVLWGAHENDPNARDPGGNPLPKYYWDKLARAIQLARDNGFLVYLTLSGEASFGSECSAYNPSARACPPPGANGQPVPVGSPGKRPTGIDPPVGEFGDFARAAALRFRGQVTAFGIWNEPNNADFLQSSPNKRAATHVLYRRLYQDAFEKMKGTGARIYIGELSQHVRTCAGAGCPARRLNSKRYLKAALESAPDPPVRTRGVAWHPYQHVKGPRNRGVLGVVGIGRTDEIQDFVDELWDDPPGSGGRLLATPGGARPNLFFTEFGYFNGPYGEGKKNPECRGCGNAYFKTEATRGDLFRQALSRAKKERVRWLTFYPATEISPQEYRIVNGREDKPPLGGYTAEYGLFSPTGEVTGRRRYGKLRAGPFFEVRPPAVPPPEFERSAFCDIYRWTRARDYKNDLASPCAG